MSEFYFHSVEESGEVHFSSVWSNENKPVVLGKKVIHGPYPSEEEAQEQRDFMEADREIAKEDFAERAAE